MKTTIHHFEASDRLILITYEGTEIVGINYTQGSEIETNLPIDQLLTTYVLKRLNYDTTRSEQLEQIDQLIWQYVEREHLLCEINNKLEQQISEIVQENCESGDVSPYEADKLEEYINKLSELVEQIVINNQ